MNISEYLKQPDSQARVSCAGAWLYWDETSSEWVIMCQKYRQRVREYGRTGSESVAVALLESATR